MYPLDRTWPSRLEYLLIRFELRLPAFCTVCGRLTWVDRISENLRESCICTRCNATNRQRQLALVACAAFSQLSGTRVRSLRDARKLRRIAVYNTEALGPIHAHLATMPSYTCSEYLVGETHSAVSGVMHQNLMDLTFDDGVFDVVLSSDVFEHIPDPYRAHREVHRVLKPGGRHVFTVPFYQEAFADEERARIDENGAVVYLKEPVYHGDPVRPGGALVYTIFSLEMLVKLNRLGMRTRMYRLHDVTKAILGPNALVFEAVKV